MRPSAWALLLVLVAAPPALGMVNEDGASPCPSPEDGNATGEPTSCVMLEVKECGHLSVSGMSGTSARLAWPDVPEADAFRVIQQFEEQAPAAREPLLSAGTNATLLEDLAGGVWTFEVQALVDGNVTASFCGQAHLHDHGPGCIDGLSAEGVAGGIRVTWPSMQADRIVVLVDVIGASPASFELAGNATQMLHATDKPAQHIFTVSAASATGTTEFCAISIDGPSAEVPFFPNALAFGLAAVGALLAVALIVRRSR